MSLSWRKMSAVAAGLALVLTACSSSSKGSQSTTTSGGSATTAATPTTAATATTSGGGSGNTASGPGVTASTITVGLITSVTGSAAPEYTGIIPSAQARIAQMNAQGGINGRQIKLITADDQSSPTGNNAAVQSLIAKGVFGIIAVSPFVFGGYKTMATAGLPVTGGAFDGPEWGIKALSNMFAYSSPQDPQDPQYDGLANFAKGLGGTKSAAVGYGVSPSSAASARGFIFAAQHVGMSSGYLNTSLPFGSVDVSAIALQLKNTGSDNLWLPLDENTNFAIISAYKQAGANIKVSVSATGYGQALLNDPTAVQAAQGVYFNTVGAPVELNNAATQNFTGALSQYAHYTGVPDFGWYTGWLGADIMLYGLKGAGQNPTRTSFIDYMHSVTNYTGNGLMANDVNWTLAAWGTALPTLCGYYTQLENKTFVVSNNGKPVCGNLIPNSNQIASGA
jgi:branched-chain amino acid transport system substrate-binding protein